MSHQNKRQSPLCRSQKKRKISNKNFTVNKDIHVRQISFNFITWPVLKENDQWVKSISVVDNAKETISEETGQVISNII